MDSAPPQSPVLVARLEGAVSLLIEPAPGDSSGRDAAATTALARMYEDPRIVVSRRPSGRPRLSAPHCELGIAMATCRDALLIGFDPLRPVGVDLEAEVSIGLEELDRLARDHFTPCEAAVIAAAAPASKRALFLCHWTAKEAALKVTGRGIYDGLTWPELRLDRTPSGAAAWSTEIPASDLAGPLRICVQRIALASVGPAWAALCVSAPAGGSALPN